ncbi:hypothetical protein HY448_01475 [Candidatus Pacearchaeota archaeon]|nr:hypothetical protein [Candidatus Pacearchaeota archaeon]
MAKKEKKSKYSEIFEVETKGKEKIVQVEGKEKEKAPKKSQIKEENKMLKTFLIIIGVVVLAFLIIYLVAYNLRTFEYRGLDFETVKFCDVKPCLVLYQTSFPVIYNKETSEYNFYIGDKEKYDEKEVKEYFMYLRNNPEKLDEEVPLTGESYILQNLVIDSTEDFNCNGEGVIAIENMKIFYGLANINIIKNKSLSCSENDEYTFVRIQSGNQTNVEQVGNSSCYNININNCEILKGTERFMVESFIQMNDLINDA